MKEQKLKFKETLDERSPKGVSVVVCVNKRRNNCLSVFEWATRARDFAKAIWFCARHSHLILIQSRESSGLIEATLELLHDTSQVQVGIAARLNGGAATDERVLERVLAASHQHATLDRGRLGCPGHEDHVGAWTLARVVVNVSNGIANVIFWQHAHESIPLGILK